MLILQRKAGESLFIGDEIEVSVLSVEAGRVRLAIDAPKSVSFPLDWKKVGRKLSYIGGIVRHWMEICEPT